LPTWLSGLFVSSGALALGAIAQLAGSWRGEIGKPSSSGAVVLLGARLCLSCWGFGLLLKAADWAIGGLWDPVPLPLQSVLGIGFYVLLLVSATGIVIAAIGATAWLIRD
jgi:hypothetical protein